MGAHVRSLEGRTLHASPLGAVRDVRCRGARVALGAEERVEDATLVFTRRGHFVVCAGGEEHAADPSAAVFLLPDRPYRVRHPVCRGDACTAVSLSGAMWSLLCSEHGLDPRRGTPHGSRVDADVDLAQRRLTAALGSGVLAPLGADEAVLGLWRVVLSRALGRTRRRPATVRSARAHAALAEGARELLHRRARARVGLAELAGALGASPFHLARVFRAHTGLSLHRYQLRVRFAEAIERIQAGERELTGLAHELGFSDHSHFTNAFKREFGCPPSSLRTLA